MPVIKSGCTARRVPARAYLSALRVHQQQHGRYAVAVGVEGRGREARRRRAVQQAPLRLGRAAPAGKRILEARRRGAWRLGPLSSPVVDDRLEGALVLLQDQRPREHVHCQSVNGNSMILFSLLNWETSATFVNCQKILYIFGNSIHTYARIKGYATYSGRI